MRQVGIPKELPTLPMHLLTSLSCLASSTIASEWLKHASKTSNLPGDMKTMMDQLPAHVASQTHAHLGKLLKSVDRYRHSIKPRDLPDMPVIWRQGNARLLDYGALCRGAPIATVLLVPSLINRYYILDLSEQMSFARYLASKRINPIILDWGAPGLFEHRFDMADYVTRILLPAIDFCASTSASKFHIAGYCLGGVLSLSACLLTEHHIDSLALLATPWDFEAEDVHIPRMAPTMLQQMEQMIVAQDTFPAAIIQSLFSLRQPFAFEQKFLRMAECDDEESFAEFMQLEQWVNDGVDMTSPAACDALINWIQKNDLASLKWEVDGQTIDPRDLNIPCFVSLPEQDLIVPYGCAEALADLLPQKETISPHAGHVGMIVGSRAKSQLWEPYVTFITKEMMR